MISISQELKEKLEKVKCYLELLEDPISIEKNSDGVYAVRDGNNKIIPGALRYGDDTGKPSVTMLGGIHMNELSGIYALLKFHKRWAKGIRPGGGIVYTSIGHPERTKEFIEAALNSDEMSPSTWSDFRQTNDFFNFNRISWNILTGKEFANANEQRAHDIIKNIIIPSRGRVLDIHNTSTEAPPMVTLFMEKGDSPEESVDRMKAAGVTDGLPIRDYVIWEPGPYNGMESIRSSGDNDHNTMPILIETGAGFDPGSFDRANDYAQIWLRNVTGLKLDENINPDDSGEIVRAHYVETGALYHPCVRPQDYRYMNREAFEEAKKDTLVLIRDRSLIDSITTWSTKARRAIEKLNDKALKKDRLDNFKPMKKGDIIAIGLKTGMEIRSPQDGYVLMVGTDPFIKPTFNETFANLGIMLFG